QRVRAEIPVAACGQRLGSTGSHSPKTPLKAECGRRFPGEDHLSCVAPPLSPCYLACSARDNNRLQGGQMRFGFFDQLPCPSGFSDRTRLPVFIEQLELGDALAFDTAWLGEIHFSRAFSILADPLMVLAAAAQRTDGGDLAALAQPDKDRRRSGDRRHAQR